MADNNDTTSMLNANTLIGLILNEFLNHVDAWSPNLAYVYDESLTYDTAMEEYRASQNISKDGSLPMPLFAFRRSVLGFDDQSNGRRIRSAKLKANLNNGTSQIYKGFMGKFTIEFAYFTRSFRDMERFEVSYLSEQGLSSIKNLDVHIPILDSKMGYSLIYDDLEDKLVNIENSYYKSLSGTFTVKGIFTNFVDIAKQILNASGTINVSNNLNLDISTNLADFQPSVNVDTITIIK